MDEPSLELRRAVFHAYERALDAAQPAAEWGCQRMVQDTCEEHFGWDRQSASNYALDAPTVDAFLDYIEILVEAGPKRWPVSGSARVGYATAWPNAEAEINALFDRHRFGYRIQNGQAHAIASPALDEAFLSRHLRQASRGGRSACSIHDRLTRRARAVGPLRNDPAVPGVRPLARAG